MFKKTIISEFFTTISFGIYFDTIKLLTYKLPKLRYGNDILSFENKLLKYLGVKNSKIISFYNGRSAIYHCINSLGLNKKDEIIVSAYTCVSVSNAVINSPSKIVYSDIEKETLGFDIEKLEKSITKNTKVIIVQHTFGKPSLIKEIISLAKEKKILVIEDCAHSLGSEINSKKLGTFGDFAIFSTGRDKVISSVTGGFLLINNKAYFSKIKKIKSLLENPSRTLVLRNLLYNVVGYEAYKTYDFLALGKIIIFLSRKLNIITEILTLKEKECNYKEFNYCFPNSLAFLASKQLNKIDTYNHHREKIADYYDKNFNRIEKIFTKEKGERNIYFRYPIICRNEELKDSFIKYMKKNHILVGNTWGGINIVPIGSNLKKAKYKKGTCKEAEEISKKILTLPNHNLVKMKEAKKVVKLINEFKVY